MNQPRFVLVLAAQKNLLRAALVLRDGRIVASAKQTFQIKDDAFDPAEVWYKMKKVVAACFDIGRTQPRELLTCAVMSDDCAWSVWQDNAGVVDSAGYFSDFGQAAAQGSYVIPARLRENDAPLSGGYARTWLEWNLSGEYVLPDADAPVWRARAGQGDAVLTEPRACDAADEKAYGTIRARSPFAEPLDITAVFAETELAAEGAALAFDELIQRAAARVYNGIGATEK